jgi:hypothetical protein
MGMVLSPDGASPQRSDTMSIFNIVVPKANHSFVIDESKMPQASLEHAHEYGWRQALVDATASVKKEDFKSDAEFRAAALAKAQAKFDAYVSGNPAGRGVVDHLAVAAAQLGVTVEQLKAAAAAAMATTKAKAKAA